MRAFAVYLLASLGLGCLVVVLAKALGYDYIPWPFPAGGAVVAILLLRPWTIGSK
jgi:hypothetical protein